MSLFSGDADRFIIVEITLRDDGTLLGIRIGSLASERMAFNTVIELNEEARAAGRQTFYQIEHQFGVDAGAVV